MEIKVLLPILLVLLQMTAYAQKEATNWYFGNKVGVSFTGDCPAPLIDGAMKTQGSSTVMSDKETGKLLFYTNGRNIWDSEHRLMPNGQDFPPSCFSSLSQAALIVPVPESKYLYYVFSMFYEGQSASFDCTHASPNEEYSCKVMYSVVDMRLNGGMGDVISSQKNTVLQRNSTEKLTAIPHANGTDFWLLTHEWKSNAFYVYGITSEGISEPVVQDIGSVHGSSGNPFYAKEEIKGLMKASPDGSKFACAVFSGEGHAFDLFDFDAATGTLSNYINLGSLRDQYGVSFSPDNSKLYVAANDSSKTPYRLIRQYDLLAGDVESIVASGQSIVYGNPHTNIPQNKLLYGFVSVFVDLQLAPDGKIYAVSDYAYFNYGSDSHPEAGKTVVIIHRPNERGHACDVNYNIFDFKEGGVGNGLPNFIQSYFNGLEPSAPFSACNAVAPEGSPLECLPTAITAYPNPTTGRVRFGIAEDCSFVQQFNLRIINAIGQEVLQGVSGLSIADEVDISDSASGLYLFILTFPDHQQVVKKVVKVK